MAGKGSSDHASSWAIRWFALLAAIACASSAASFPAHAVAAYPGNNGRIAYIGGFGSSGFNLYTALPSGNGVRKLLEGALDPAWSPNGRRIAIVRRASLYTIAANGHDKTRVISEPKIEYSAPQFSPSGRRVVYVRDNLEIAGRDVPRRRSIYTIRSDGTDRKAVVRSTYTNAPEYSPNGEKIVFAGHPLGRPSGIWTVRPNGTDLERLTHYKQPSSRYYVDFPDWRPDGRRIIFLRCDKEASFMGPCTGDLVAMRPDGTKQRRITAIYGDFRPVYSPRGDQIALTDVHASPPCSDVITLALGNRSVHRVSHFCGPPVSGRAFAPSWQPLPPSGVE